MVVEVGWLLGSRKDPSYRILREGFSIYFCHQRCESGFFPPKLYTQIWREERYKNLLDENPKDMKTFGSIDTKTSENLLAPKIRNHTKYYSITP